ncbi:MAG: hypothetical protein LAP87_02590 [Acidobacteriia bacterium]|nr:hypothetical protein [Terriglobia bacterium]
MSSKRTRTTVYLDNSVESERVAEELDRIGTSYNAIYMSSVTKELPAIKSDLHAVYGYDKIRGYFLQSLPPRKSPSRG